MQAFVLVKYGSPLREVTMAEPAARPHEVLVRMVAAGVNHADERTRAGEFKAVLPLKLPKVMGGELSGEIIAVGSDVSGFAVGDLVYAYTGVDAMGTFAQVVAVDAAALARTPTTLSTVQAAALPVVALTAWQALTGIAQVGPGQTVLVHGGAGGVGAVAIQLAKHLGATVATTVSGSSVDFARDRGADIVIDYRTEAFVERLKDVPIDVVLDTQGGEVLTRSLEVLRVGGTIIGITGPPDPAFAEQVGANIVVKQALRVISARTRRRAKAHGVTYRFLFIEPDGAALRAIARLVDDGVLRPHIDRVLAFAQTPQALAQLIAGGTNGKVLVTTDPDAVTHHD